MSNPTDLKLSKWPFFLGYAVMLGCAYVIFMYARRENSPMGHWEEAFFLFSIALGSVLAILPSVMEYRAAVKMVETGALVSTLSQLENLEAIAGQIGGATAQWQGVQEHSARTTVTAREIADRMSAEAAAFTEFLQKSNDGEKANLRLEIEKLRRAEGDWLQIVVRMLDHTYALHQAAVRSGQAGLIDQLGHFQNSCRDVARRIGLIPFVPVVNDPFDARCHESPDSQAISMANPRVRDTVATGYTFQGKLIRPALVSLQNPPPSGAALETFPPATMPEVNGNAAKQQIEIEEQSFL